MMIGPTSSSRYPRCGGTSRALARLLNTFSALLLVALLGGCASSASKRLASLTPPSPEWGDVLLYRAGAQWAAGEIFDVRVDDQPVIGLANAAALWLRLRPGTHVIAVEPRGARQRAEIAIGVVAGQRQFVHYDFATRSLANDAFTGSALRLRQPADAVPVIAGLRLIGDRCEGVCPLRPIVVGNAVAIDDVDAVPSLNAKGRAGYRAWLRRAPPRAFVLGSEGQWHASWGRQSVERAIQQCRDSGTTDCRLYAVDHRVVWDRH